MDTPSTVPGSPACAAYLSMGPDGVLSPLTVFYKAKTLTNAEALCRLFARVTGATPSAVVHSHTVGSLQLEDRVLLEAALDDLSCYTDPDPGVYDPRPSTGVLHRAMQAQVAARWEVLVEQEAGQMRKRPQPDQQAVADLVVLCMILRDILRIEQEFPETLPPEERETWLSELASMADLTATAGGVEIVSAVLSELAASSLPSDETLGMIMSSLLLLRPEAAAGGDGLASIPAATAAAMKGCQASASPDVKQHMQRLDNLMNVKCRYPTGPRVVGAQSPERALQLLERYWAIGSSLVLTQSTVLVGFVPHPLLRWIENLRDRVRQCFARLSGIDGAPEVAQAADGLLLALTEGDPDELSAVSEWTQGRLTFVQCFIERARLRFISGPFPLTGAEEHFLRCATELAKQHDARVRAEWKRLQTDASERSHPPKPGSATAKVDAAGSSESSGGLLILGSPGTPSVVLGRQKPPLTDGQDAVVRALVSAGKTGLTKDALESVRPSARRMLDDLRQDVDWAAVIIMPGRTNGRYRVRS